MRTAVRIGSDLITDTAAQQFINRNAQNLTLDIPDGLVDAADCGAIDEAALPEAVAVHLLIDHIHISGVFADHAALRQYMDCRFGSQFLTLDAGFAPAIDALIGHDFYKQPVLSFCVNQVCFYFSNFHNKILPENCFFPGSSEFCLLYHIFTAAARRF